MRKKSSGNLITILLIIIILFIVFLLGMVVLNYMFEFMGNDLKIENKPQSDSWYDKVISSKRQDEESMEVINITEEKNEIKEVANNNYHYLQIDDTAKIIYNKLNNNIEQMKSGRYSVDFGKQFNELLHNENGKSSLNKSYQQAIDALMLDYPEYFFINIEKLIMTVTTTTINKNTTYEVSIGNEDESYLEYGFYNKSDVDNAIKQIQNFKNQITGDSEYKIVLNVHDMLVDNVEYDQTLNNQNIRNVYGTLCNKKAVCEGYAKAFKYLMDEVNIPCIVVIGKGINSEGKTEAHAWNYVKLNGIWYGIDVTWDDPILIGRGRLSNKDRYKYFLRGKGLLENHTPTGVASETGIIFSYPELSNDYR